MLFYLIFCNLYKASKNCFFLTQKAQMHLQAMYCRWYVQWSSYLRYTWPRCSAVARWTSTVNCTTVECQVQDRWNTPLQWIMGASSLSVQRKHYYTFTKRAVLHQAFGLWSFAFLWTLECQDHLWTLYLWKWRYTLTHLQPFHEWIPMGQ